MCVGMVTLIGKTSHLMVPTSHIMVTTPLMKVHIITLLGTIIIYLVS